jgi:hypothetical protein
VTGSYTRRLLRFVQFTFGTVMFARKMARSQAGENALISAVYKSTASFSLPLTLTLPKHVALASGSVFVLIHAVNTPLPFLQQLLLHCAYFVILITLQLAPAMTLLGAVLHSNEAHTLCTALNYATQLLESTVLGTSFNTAPHDGQCRAHSRRMLLLFADVYLAFLLPVYISVRLERYSKRLYMYLELDGPEPLQPPIAMEVWMVAVLGLAAWVLVLLSHEHLATWVHPL